MVPPDGPLMVYNKGKTMINFLEPTPAIYEMMQGRLVAFFLADFDGKTISFLQELENQGW